MKKELPRYYTFGTNIINKHDIRNILDDLPFGTSIDIVPNGKLDTEMGAEGETSTASLLELPPGQEIETISIGRFGDEIISSHDQKIDVIDDNLDLKEDLKEKSPLSKFPFGTVIETVELSNLSGEIVEEKTTFASDKHIELIKSTYCKKPEDISIAKKTLSNHKNQKAIYDISCEIANHIKICVWNGHPYFNGVVWKLLTRENLALLIQDTPCRDILPYLDKGSYDSILYNLSINRNLQVDKNDVCPSQDLVCLLDKYYNIRTGKFHTKDASLFFRTCINVSSTDLSQNSGEKFEEFIYPITNGNLAHRQLLLEVMGVCITRILPKNFFIALGPHDSGKSLYARLISNLIGNENCFPINDLNDLTERFALSSFADINLCLGLDLPNTVISKKAISIVKMLTGNDIVKAEAKFKQNFSFKNEAKILLATNHIPKVRDSEKEDAFFSRMVVVPFLNTIPKHEQNMYLLEELLNERGYIVAQAFDALIGLISRNYEFSLVDIPSETFLYDNGNGFYFNKDLSLSETVYRYITERCTFETDSETLISTLYEDYIDYCTFNNLRSTNNSAFSRIVARNYPSLIPYRETGSELRGYKGIAIRKK